MNGAPPPDPAASGHPAPEEPSTGFHPPGDQPSELALAEYDAGVPDAEAAAAIMAHVAGCASCQRILTVLQSVRDDVRREFAPMPAAVSQRLAASLTPAGAAGPSTVDGQGRHRAPEVVELATARRVRRLRAIGAVAAGLIVLGGGGYLVVDQGHLGSGADSAVSADQGAGGDSLNSGAEVDADEGPAGAGLPVFDRQSLQAAAGELLTNAPLATDGGRGTTDVDAGCLASLPVATGEALSITRAVYEGQPALVVLFPGPPGRVQVTVLSDCGEAGERRVLDQFTADR